MRNVQLGIPNMSGDGSPLPRAAALQRAVTQADKDLCVIAASRGRLVAWWWGIRKVEGVTSAVCYVCDQTIVSGAFNVGISESALDMIDSHWRSHWPEIKEYRRVLTTGSLFGTDRPSQPTEGDTV